MRPVGERPPDGLAGEAAGGWQDQGLDGNLKWIGKECQMLQFTSAKYRGRIQRGKNPLEKPPENPPETKF